MAPLSSDLSRQTPHAEHLPCGEHGIRALSTLGASHHCSSPSLLAYKRHSLSCMTMQDTMVQITRESVAHLPVVPQVLVHTSYRAPYREPGSTSSLPCSISLLINFHFHFPLILRLSCFYITCDFLMYLLLIFYCTWFVSIVKKTYTHFLVLFFCSECWRSNWLLLSTCPITELHPECRNILLSVTCVNIFFVGFGNIEILSNILSQLYCPCIFI